MYLKKKSKKLTVLSASLLTPVNFLKQFLSCGWECRESKSSFQLQMISENCDMVVKLLLTLKGVLHSSQICSNTQKCLRCTLVVGGSHTSVSIEVFQSC